jgi:predicted Zn-dependent peptidase
VSPEADRATVERAVAEEVEGLGVEALPNVELEKSRNQSVTTWLLNWQSVQNRGQWLGQGAIRFDDPRAALRRLEALGSLTPEEVRRAAASYLAASRRTVVWVVPEPQPVEGEP